MPSVVREFMAATRPDIGVRARWAAPHGYGSGHGARDATASGAGDHHRSPRPRAAAAPDDPRATVDPAGLGLARARGGDRIAAGVIAGSVALVGFGADSVIEAGAGLVVLWLVTGDQLSSRPPERRAQQLIAGSFLAEPRSRLDRLLASTRRGRSPVSAKCSSGNTATSQRTKAAVPEPIGFGLAANRRRFRSFGTRSAGPCRARRAVSRGRCRREDRRGPRGGASRHGLVIHVATDDVGAGDVVMVTGRKGRGDFFFAVAPEIGSDAASQRMRRANKDAPLQIKANPS
jgi:hypothetical protein